MALLCSTYHLRRFVQEPNNKESQNTTKYEILLDNCRGKWESFATSSIFNLPVVTSEKQKFSDRLA